jgi:hypothetical protein
MTIIAGMGAYIRYCDRKPNAKVSTN